MASIDTLKYYQDLIAAGESAEKAKAHVYTLSDNLSMLPTKEDLHNEMQSIKTAFDLKIDSFKTQENDHYTTLRMIGVGLLVAVIINLFLKAKGF